MAEKSLQFRRDSLLLLSLTAAALRGPLITRLGDKIAAHRPVITGGLKNSSANSKVTKSAHNSKIEILSLSR